MLFKNAVEFIITELKSKFVGKSVRNFLIFLKEKSRSLELTFFSLPDDFNIFYIDRYMDLYKDYKDTTVLFLFLFYLIK